MKDYDEVINCIEELRKVIQETPTTEDILTVLDILENINSRIFYLEEEVDRIIMK